MRTVTETYRQYKESLESLMIGVSVEGVEKTSIDVPPQAEPLIGTMLGKLSLYRFAVDDIAWPGPDDVPVFSLAPMLEAVFEPSEGRQGLLAYGVRFDYERFSKPADMVTGSCMAAITQLDTLRAENYRAAMGPPNDCDLLESYRDDITVLGEGSFDGPATPNREVSRLIEAVGIAIKAHIDDVGISQLRETFTVSRPY
jgi:hypothetical protein